ncbi:MAG: GDSL-type esterase/lipase family protein [Gammaproteobacteria bacterium]
MSGTRRSFYIILPVFACLIGVLLVELGLALFYPIPYSLEKNMYFEPDPHTGYRQKPLGSGGYPNGVAAIANSQGNRDDVVAIPKPDGVFRILMIGDSFTVGANVEQPDVYPQVLERMLNESGGPPVEIVNTGTGGWSPFQYAQFLEYYGAQYEPDLVLVGFFVGNDLLVDRFAPEQTMTAVLGRRVSREAAANAAIALRVMAYENSHIYRALMRSKPGDMSFVRQSAGCDDFNDYYLAVQTPRAEVHLAELSAADRLLEDQNIVEIERMKRKAAELGAGFAVVIIPDENQINPALQAKIIPADEMANYDFSQPQAYLAEQFAERGIASLDLLDVFRNDPRCLYMNDTHWVAAGHKLAAENIRDYLYANKLVP